MDPKMNVEERKCMLNTKEISNKFLGLLLYCKMSQKALSFQILRVSKKESKIIFLARHRNIKCKLFEMVGPT